MGTNYEAQLVSWICETTVQEVPQIIDSCISEFGKRHPQQISRNYVDLMKG